MSAVIPFTDCSKKLGIESRVILDAALTSSTPFRMSNAAKYSRLNSMTSWGAHDQLSANPWIQVCFTNIKSVSGIILQGRADAADNRVTKFTLKYGYADGNPPYDYKMNGNIIVSSVKLSTLITLSP